MASDSEPGQARPEFNLTEFSTLSLLVGVGLTSAALWAVIAIIVGA